MYNLYNFKANHYPESLIIAFRKFLVADKVAKGTVRSYISDVRFFFAWLISFLTDTHIFEASSSPFSDSDSLLALINQRLLAKYEDYLQSNNVPLKTINRRYSALRKLGSFSASQSVTAENVFASLKTHSESSVFSGNEHHLEEFKATNEKSNADFIKRLAALGIEAECRGRVIPPANNGSENPTPTCHSGLSRIIKPTHSPFLYILSLLAVFIFILGIGIYDQTQNKGQVLSPTIISPLSSENDSRGSSADFRGSSTGTAIIPCGLTEIKIASPYITEKSSMQITPLGSTDNQVLYIKEQNHIEKTVTIGIDRETTSDLKFNWQIVN